MCNFWEVNCQIGEAISAAGDNIIAQWAQSIMEGLSGVLATAGSLWVQVGTPTIAGESGSVYFITSVTRWIVLALAIASIIIAGIKMVWTSRAEPGKDLLRSFFTLIVTSALSVSVAQMLITGSDEFSRWVLQQSLIGDNGNFLLKILAINQYTGPGIGMVIIILGGLIGIIVNLVQIGLMFVRIAMLVLLVGMIPLAGAITNPKWGEAWLGKAIGFSVALIAFKPAAAIIYATAIKLIQGDTWSIFQGDNLTSFVLGIIMMALAVLSLPALIMFLVPATSAVANGGGGGGGAMVGAVAATGAMSVMRGAGGANDSATDTHSSTSSTSSPGGAGNAPPSSTSGTGSSSEQATTSTSSSAETAANGAGTSTGAANTGASGASAATGAGASGAASGASAGGAGGAAAAGSAAGPVGMAAGAAIQAGGQIASGVKEEVNNNIPTESGSGAKEETQ